MQNVQTDVDRRRRQAAGFDRSRAAVRVGRRRCVAAGGAGAAAADAPKQQTVVKDEWSKTPRNAPCPCGRGKKFKLCHGAA